eukprot:412411_1
MMQMALKVLVMNGKQKKAITRRRLQESDYKKENQCGANDIDSWKETDTDVVVDEDNNNNDIPPPLISYESSSMISNNNKKRKKNGHYDNINNNKKMKRKN